MKTPTILIAFFLLILNFTLIAQQDDTTKLKPSYFEVNDFVEDNEACFVCHGEVKYTLEDSENDRSATKRMAPCKVVDREKYYTSVHSSFSCTDCHSYDFMTFPHNIKFDITPPFDDGHPSLVVIQWYTDGSVKVVYPPKYASGEFEVPPWVKK